jgi:hypothetical protein
MGGGLIERNGESARREKTTIAKNDAYHVNGITAWIDSICEKG